MQALIENSTGRVQGWAASGLTAGAGQTLVDSPDNLNLIGPIGIRYLFATSKAVSSATFATGTVTITTSAPHGYFTGVLVTIAGATQPEYNGTRSITVTGATTFTFPTGGTPVSPALGTITATAIPGFYVGGQAEIDADVLLTKDQEADDLFGAGSGDRGVSGITLKKILAAVLKVTHDHLQALETAGGFPANTVPGFAAFVNLVKADYRARL